MGQWVTFPFAGELNKNVGKISLTSSAAKMENCYVDEMRSLVRFPRLTTKATLPDPSQPVYLKEYRDDLYAICGGRTYRVNDDFTFEDVTGETISGGRRVSFAETEDDLVMAAGRKLVRLRGEQTELLSEAAPESTHVGWIASYLVAIEPFSGRFRYSSADSFYVDWNDLNVISAEGRPDNLNSMIVSDYGQLMLGGDETIEQFDTSPSGDLPLYRRWVIPHGVYAPDTLINANNRVWCVNQLKEFVGVSTQTGSVYSGKIQKVLEAIDSWEAAFAFELPIDGQRFIVLQMPYATNDYGTKGVTLIYDYNNRRWGELFGFSLDVKPNLPNRWDGWSYAEVNGRKLIGGTGKIYQLGGDSGDVPQIMRWRTGHLRASGRNFSITKLQMTVQRGVGSSTESPIISLKVNKDNRGFGRSVRKTLGKSGQSHALLDFGNLGTARGFQIEVEVADNASVNVADVQAYIEPMDE